MRAARRGAAMIAVLGLGLGLVACRGSDDDDAVVGLDRQPGRAVGHRRRRPPPRRRRRRRPRPARPPRGHDAGGAARPAPRAAARCEVNEAAAAVECPASEHGPDRHVDRARRHVPAVGPGRRLRRPCPRASTPGSSTSTRRTAASRRRRQDPRDRVEVPRRPVLAAEDAGERPPARRAGAGLAACSTRSARRRTRRSATT